MPAEEFNYTELRFSISATVQSQKYHAFCVSGSESNSKFIYFVFHGYLVRYYSVTSC